MLIFLLALIAFLLLFILAKVHQSSVEKRSARYWEAHSRDPLADVQDSDAYLIRRS